MKVHILGAIKLTENEVLWYLTEHTPLKEAGRFLYSAESNKKSPKTRKIIFTCFLECFSFENTIVLLGGILHKLNLYISPKLICNACS